jgi:small-conductance mechanosensitive channel
MKPIPLIKGLIFIGLLSLLFVFRYWFYHFFQSLEVPEKFTPTLYHVLMTFFTLEGTRLIITSFYKPQGQARRDNLTTGISHLARIFYVLLTGVLFLSLFNISLKEAFTSLSLIAAAVVLMTKDYIANLINGMYLTFARVVNIGDTVKIEENKGKILDITLTNVHLLNDDDDIVYIPNNKVFSSEVINYTRRELKKSSIEFEMDMNYVPEVAWLEQEIKRSLGELEGLIQPGTITLKVQSIKQEFCLFKFQYILLDPLNKEHDKKVRRNVITFIISTTIKLRNKEV